MFIPTHLSRDFFMIPFFDPKILYPFKYSKQVMNEILQSAQETFSLGASLDIILL